MTTLTAASLIGETKNELKSTVTLKEDRLLTVRQQVHSNMSAFAIIFVNNTHVDERNRASNTPQYTAIL